MTRKPFDYSSFVMHFRQRCAERGIDPLEGATRYDVVTLKADTVRAHIAATVSDWWQDADLWCEAAPYRDMVEEEAIEHIRLKTFANGVTVTPSIQPHSTSDAPQPDACPYCGAASRYQHFWQFNTNGRQYVCSQCNRFYTPERGKTSFSDELHERAYTLHCAGKTNKEIAETLHVSRHTIQSWLKAQGVTRLVRPVYPEDIRQKAFDLHAQGMIVEHIAKTLNVHERTIALWIRSGVVAPKRAVYAPELRQRALELRDIGKKAPFIAQVLDIPYNTIRRWLQGA